MSQIEYEYSVEGEPTRYFGKYRWDEEIAKLERVPVSDEERVRMYLQLIWITKKVTVNHTFHKQIINL